MEGLAARSLVNPEMKYPTLRIACSFLLAALLAGPAASFAQKDDPESSPLACALFFTRRLDPDSSFQRNALLAGIAKSSWLSGNPDRALRISREMSCDEQAYISIYLADRAIKARQKDYALKFIEQSLACAKDGEDFYRKGEVFNKFVVKLIELQQNERALAVAEAIEDETSHKASAFTALAEAHAAAGQNEQALRMFDRAFTQAKIAGEEYSLASCEALGRIAAGYAQLGKTDQAAAALSFAGQLAEQEDDLNRARVKSIVAEGYAKAGQDEQALHLAELLDSDRRVDTLIAIASVYVRKGQKAKALALLSQVAHAAELSNDYENNKERDFAEIVRVYLRADEPQQAAQMASRIRAGLYRKEAALEIADWSLKHGRERLAAEALDSASQKISLIVSEKPEEILPAMSFSRAREKAALLSEISDKYIEAGQFDKAEQAISAIDLPQWKAGKLADLAGAMARGSSHGKVKELLAKALRLSDGAAEYPHDVYRDLALTNIAGRYAEAGDREQAARLFARVLEMVRKLESYDDRVTRLAEIGLSYERAGMKAGPPIRSVLRNIIREWVEDED